MTIMIPDNIDQQNSKLGGERLVFDMLRDSEIKGLALHSLWQKNQPKKIMGEVDFLLITSKGMLCIEVKGGCNIYRKDGKWYSVARNDKEYEIKNPFKQAQDCMFSLKKYLKENVPKYKNVMVGMAVVFPECIFTGSGNDLLTEVMYDCKYSGNFTEYIKSVYKYWEEQYYEKNNFIGQKLSENDIKNLQTIFRGDFASVPSLNTEMDIISNYILHLTEEQYNSLNVLTEDNDRVLVKGVAGTGKSLIAIEKTRKLIAMGLKVGYICYNRNMGQLARKMIGDIPAESYVGTFNKLLTHYIPETDNTLPLSEICAKFKSTNIQPDKYDVLIVDEAQDLMDFNIIEALSLFLKQGIEDGKWVILFDPNQNIFQTDKNFDDVFEYLKKGCNATVTTLRINCRNTKQIADSVSQITKVETAQVKNIIGSDIVIKSYEDNSELISLLRQTIQSLITGGINPQNIVILSKYKLDKSGLKNIKSIANMSVVEMTGIPDNITNKNILKYYTVQSFKGLESDIVFYIDIDGFSDDINKMINYVALSRAKSFLYIFFNKSLNDEFFNEVF